jgi:PKD repeat protein
MVVGSMDYVHRSQWTKVLSTLVFLAFALGMVEDLQVVDDLPATDDGGEGSVSWARHSTALPVNKVLDLSRYPDALGFRLGDWEYDLGGTSHIQGITRFNAADGTPYLIVTTSGHPGKLLVVEMASRDKTGERMRSNRIDPHLDTKDTAPPVEDKVVVVHELEWNHGGGVQVIDNYLLVAVESGIGVNQDEKGSFIVYNVSDPANIVQVYEHPDLGHKAGVLAVTREDDGHYLIMLGPSAYCGCEGTSWDNSNHYMRFFRSNFVNNISGGFDYVNEWHADGDFNRQDNQWDPTYQTLNFVRDEVTGYLYVIGMWNSYTVPGVAGGDDYIDVFRVTRTGTDYQVIKDAMVNRLHMNSKSADSQEQCNFISSGGVYISPGGELIIYSTTHYKETASSIDYIRVAEYRSIDVASAGSPLWGPRAIIKEPYIEVEEGDTSTIDGSLSSAQSVKGFIQLFENDDYQDKRVIIDWDDCADHMTTGATWVDLDNVDGFGADADSLKIFVPPGSAIMLGHKDWESNRLGRLLEGTPGTGVISLPDLDGNRWEMLYNDVWYPTDDPMGDDIRFVLFTGNGSVDLDVHSWDLGDGTNLAGPPVIDHVYLDDGLYLVNLTVNQTDGDEARANATVRVLNVPPSVVAGVDTEVNEDKEVELNGSFTDPGVLDKHSIEWDLGDGTKILDTLVPMHTYHEPGTYTVRLTVTDDDGGEGNDTFQITVRDVTSPSAVSPGDLDVEQGDTIVLDGRGSHDNVGIVSYRWSFLYDGQMETLEGATREFTFDVPGNYKVRLVVTDAAGLEDQVDLMVNVVDINDPPEFLNEVPPQVDIYEDEIVWLFHPATDEEDDQLTWSADSERFPISSTNGSIRFDPTHADIGDWWFNVTVTDSGGLTDTVSFKVVVVNVNDAPVITSISPENGTVFKEGRRVTFTVVAMDEDGDDVTVTWASDGKVLGTGTSLDYKKLKPGTHVIKVSISDGIDTIEEEFTLVIKKEEEGPAFGMALALMAIVIAMFIGHSRRSIK